MYAALLSSSAWCRTQACMRERGRPCRYSGVAPCRPAAPVTASRTRDVVAVPVAAVEGDHHVGRVPVDRVADGVGDRVDRRARPAVSGPAAPVQTGVGEVEHLHLGDAEGGGRGPQLRLPQLADSAGRDRDAGLDLARLARGSRRRRRSGRRAPPRASAASRSRTSRRRGGRPTTRKVGEVTAVRLRRPRLPPPSPRAPRTSGSGCAASTPLLGDPPGVGHGVLPAGRPAPRRRPVPASTMRVGQG